MTPIRLGIIGAGRLSSKKIYPSLHRLPVELAAVCDLDQGRAEKVGRSFGAGAVYTDHRTMIEREQLDAVIICVSPEAHASLAVDLMNHGLHVYTEKPPAVTSEAARGVLDTSQRTDRICMTGFKKRFAPSYCAARAAIDSGDLGDPELLSIDYCCGPTYRNNPAEPRSMFLLDFAIHIIDLTRYLCGEVAEVSAIARAQRSFVVSLQFENGAIGSLALSSQRDWAVPTEKVELTGAAGKFLSVDNSIEYVRFDGARIVDHRHPSFSTARGDSLEETGFAPELEAFVSAVQTGTRPESSIESSYRTMILHDAIAESARTGGSVALPGADHR